jgi:DNA invertase Pin-like site-specific DNA recombinase
MNTSTKSSRIAIYARVSTQDQDPGLQLSELRRYIQDSGWTVYQEYVYKGQSGAKDSRLGLTNLWQMPREDGLILS